MNVLVLGDSFAFGHGCSDRVFYYDWNQKKFIGDRIEAQPPSEYCWASLLQKQYSDKLKVHNVSSVGRSMQGMFHDLVYWLNSGTKFDLVIFTGTVRDRVEMPMVHDHNASGSWGLSWERTLPPMDWQPEEFANAKVIYTKYLYNDTIGNHLALSALMGSYALTISHKINFLWSVPVNCFSEESFYDLADSITDYEIPSLMGYDFSYRGDAEFNKTFQCIDGHNNNLGHSIYYENEIRPAVKRILGV